MRRIIKLTRLPKDKDLQVDITVREMVSITVAESWRREMFWLTWFASLPTMGISELPHCFSRFVAKRVRFEFDPEDIELIRLPSAIARDIRAGRLVCGDCDDMAVLLGSMLCNRGYIVRYTVISTSPIVPEFRHVFTEVYCGSDRWMALDPAVAKSYSTDGLRRRSYMVPWRQTPKLEAV